MKWCPFCRRNPASVVRDTYYICSECASWYMVPKTPMERTLTTDEVDTIVKKSGAEYVNFIHGNGARIGFKTNNPYKLFQAISHTLQSEKAELMMKEVKVNQKGVFYWPEWTVNI